MSEHQEKVYYQTDNWRNEELPRKRRLFSLSDSLLSLGTGLFETVLSAPFLIVRFMINWIKSFFGTTFTYVVAKIGIYLLLSAFFGVFETQLHWISWGTAKGVISWYEVHVLGGSRMIGMVNPDFEFVIILVIATLVAVVATKSDFADLKEKAKLIK